MMLPGQPKLSFDIGNTDSYMDTDGLRVSPVDILFCHIGRRTVALIGSSD